MSLKLLAHPYRCMCAARGIVSAYPVAFLRTSYGVFQFRLLEGDIAL
jgi:hypothetical protein